MRNPIRLAVFAAAILTLAQPAMAQTSQADIEAVKAAIAKQGLRWSAGETAMTRLAPEEISARLIPIDEYREMVALAEAMRSRDGLIRPLPAPEDPVFDWRDVAGEDWTSPVKDQGQCGSCTIFAGVGAIEGAINVAMGYPDADYDLSEQNLLSCTGVSCESGGMSPAAAYTWANNRGVPDDLCQVYEAVDGECDDACEDIDARSLMVSEWDFVANGSPMATPTVDQIKAALSTYGPIGTSMTVYNDLMMYTGGVYEVADGASELGGHSVVIVGWNDENDSWYVKNSWGTSWGDAGFFEIKRGESGLGEATTSWATVDPASVPGAFALSDDHLSASLAYRSGDTSEQTLTLERTAGDGDIPFTVVVGGDAPWLSVEPAEGTISAGQDAEVVFTFDESAWAVEQGFDQEVAVTVLGGPGFARGLTVAFDITGYQADEEDAGVDAGDEADGDDDGCGCASIGGRANLGYGLIRLLFSI